MQNQQLILDKYKEVTAKLRSQVFNKDVRDRLIEINEAFLVLSDEHLKNKYDYALSSNTENNELLELLSIKRERAEKFITDKLPNPPKKRKKNIWPAILCGILILSAIGSIGRACSQIMNQGKSAEVVKVGNFVTPEDWTNFKIDHAFSISIPNTMELRNDYDEYTTWISDELGILSNDEAVFQQKGLSSVSSEAYDTYARVIIQHVNSYSDYIEHHNQALEFTEEDYKSLRELADDEIVPYTYYETPSWRWIDVDGTKAIEVSYKRNGDEGPVSCKIYLLSNYTELAKIIVSYREKDSSFWESDLLNIIRTFKWNVPK